jgi:hypothetical protein
MSASDDNAKGSPQTIEKKAKVWTLWPELVVVVLTVLFILAAFGIRKPGTGAERVRIPIPASKFEGGTEFLSPGQAVSLNVVVPNASKTPVVQASTYGKVVQVRGEEAPVVLIEVMPASAEALQEPELAAQTLQNAQAAAEALQNTLSVEGAKVTLRLLQTMPTTAPTATATPRPQGVLIPIPADKLVGGVEFLSPAQVVGLSAIVPNASKTPEVRASTYGTVLEVRGKEAPAVLIAVPPESADGFQQALVAEGAKVAYKLVDAIPTATPTPEATAAATMTPGPVTGYVEIEVGKVKRRASTLHTAEAHAGNAQARLVIVEKREEAPPGKPEAVTTTYLARPFCVQVDAFLDAGGNRQPAYDSQTTIYVLVSFDIAKLDAIAASLSAADTIWIENQPNCQ